MQAVEFLDLLHVLLCKLSSLRFLALASYARDQHLPKQERFINRSPKRRNHTHTEFVQRLTGLGRGSSSCPGYISYPPFITRYKNPNLVKLLPFPPIGNVLNAETYRFFYFQRIYQQLNSITRQTKLVATPCWVGYLRSLSVGFIGLVQKSLAGIAVV